MKKSSLFIFVFFVSFIFVFLISPIANAGIPHIIYGNITNSDGSIPSDGTIKLKAYITQRQNEILTESDTGCGYKNGMWWIEAGNFNTPWSIGEILNITASTVSSQGDSKDITLNSDGNQKLALSITGTTPPNDDPPYEPPYEEPPPYEKPQNNAPVADAGSNQNIKEKYIVTLDGSGSYDPDSDTISYKWTQTKGSEVILSNPDSSETRFTAPEVGSEGESLEFKLTVKDTGGLEAVDICIVNIIDTDNIVKNLPPIVNAGEDQNVYSGDTVTLNGSGSYDDEDGDNITFLWEQKDGPLVTLSDKTDAKPDFTAPDAGTQGVSLTFELTVTDTKGLKSTDTSIVNIHGTEQNHEPAANAGEDQTVKESMFVVLDGSGSSDPEGSQLYYTWEQTAGTVVNLSDKTYQSPAFLTPPVSQEGVTLSFKLTVENEQGLKASDVVSIVVEDNGITGFPDEVYTLTTSTGKNIGIMVNGGILNGLRNISPSELADNSNIPDDMLYGIQNLYIIPDDPGGSAELIFYLPESAPEGYKWYRYDNQTGWHEMEDVSDANRKDFSFMLTDGGTGDNSGEDGNIEIILGLGREPAAPVPPGQPDETPEEPGQPSEENNNSGGDGDSGCFIAVSGDQINHFNIMLLMLLFPGIILAINAVSQRRWNMFKYIISHRFIKLMLIIICFNMAFAVNPSLSSAGNFNFELKAGLNGISIPFEDTGITTADELLKAVPGCDLVKYWDAAQQKYIEYYKDGTGDNFKIIAGSSYFIRVNEDAEWNIYGGDSAYPPEFPITTTDTTNINVVAIPIHRFDITNAEELAQAIPDCDTVWYWNSGQNGYIGHPIGTEINNFSVLPGYAYLVNVARSSGIIEIVFPPDGSVVSPTTTPLLEIKFNEPPDENDTISIIINGVDKTSSFTITPEGAVCSNISELQIGVNTLTAEIMKESGDTYSTTSVFRVGTTVQAVPGANPKSGAAPLTVHFVTKWDDSAGTMHFFQWDFGDGNKTEKNSIAQDYYHTYTKPGTYYATLTVNSSAGGTASSSMVINVGEAVVSKDNIINYLNIEKDTVGYLPALTGTDIETIITAETDVTIQVKDNDGNVIRTLVNKEKRLKGTYKDHWDCKDDSNIVVNDGLYYAVLQYTANGETRTYDLTESTGGAGTLFTSGPGCNQYDPIQSSFSPYEDNFLPIVLRLCKASEVTIFVGPTGSGLAETRVRTILNRKALPSGTNTIYWDGLDDFGYVAHPPLGSQLVMGMWGYDLPSNAIYMTGGRPVISSVVCEPNYFNPLSNTCLDNGDSIEVKYAVSENVDMVELRVIDVHSRKIIRKIQKTNVTAGENYVFWDGKNADGEYADAGDYQLALIATDPEGNSSLLSAASMVRLFR